jgi:hypothetical protein
MNFILFNVILLFAGFPAVLIFSVGLMVTLAPMALFAKSGNPPKAFMLPLMGIAGIYQVYFWGFWSAFCVAMTSKFTQKPEVTWDWLYWITGFMECTALIGWLAFKERRGSRSLAEVGGIEKGTILYSLIAIAAFLVFAFAPSFMLRPYGWALTPLGLTRHIASQAANSVEISGGKPYAVHCAEPLPVFTLGKNSNPTKAQETALCACIWQSLGKWEREVSEKIAKGKVSEVSALHMRAFPSRFGSAIEKCGGMKL